MSHTKLFRIKSIDLLNYALESDQNYSGLAKERRLMVTCLDQFSGDISATEQGCLDHYVSVAAFAKKLNTTFSALGESHTDTMAMDWSWREAARPALLAPDSVG